MSSTLSSAIERVLSMPSFAIPVPSKPRVVVGLDFGTTFSGFAYAHVTDPENVFTFYEYPIATGKKQYCKTLTESYYKNVGGVWQFKSWGYPARAEFVRDFKAVRKQRGSGPSGDPLQPSIGTVLVKFKLHLASKDMGASTAQDLPPGLTVAMLITDYLREMGALVLTTLQACYGAQLTKQEIQWCVTVPSIWDNAAKAVMKTCMASAGLVDGRDGSLHPLIVVLEPEAASFFCRKVMPDTLVLRVGERLLVADIGGGTTDIVVQKVVSVGKSGYCVREVTTSSGGLCGGTSVDARFMEFLHKRIGPCLQDSIKEQHNLHSQLLQAWEQQKSNFGNWTGESTEIMLPARLAVKWENYDLRMDIPQRDSYDEIEISYQEMQSIFDPFVEQNLQLIAHQLQQSGNVKVLVVVGGFGSSPYLITGILQRFRGVVQIVTPPNPGSAVCQGAVMLALNPDTVLSRVCKKTYGISHYDDFDESLDPEVLRVVIDGVSRCSKRFSVYVRKGDKVDVNSCISRVFYLTYPKQKPLTFLLFSSNRRNPRYTVGAGVRKEGEIAIDISKGMTLKTVRQVKVSLFFGRSTMEIKAEAEDFSAGRPRQSELPVEVSFC